MHRRGRGLRNAANVQTNSTHFVARAEGEGIKKFQYSVDVIYESPLFEMPFAKIYHAN